MEFIQSQFPKCDWIPFCQWGMHNRCMNDSLGTENIHFPSHSQGLNNGLNWTVCNIVTCCTLSPSSLMSAPVRTPKGSGLKPCVWLLKWNPRGQNAASLQTNLEQVWLTCQHIYRTQLTPDRNFQITPFWMLTEDLRIHVDFFSDFTTKDLITTYHFFPLWSQLDPSLLRVPCQCT